MVSEILSAYNCSNLLNTANMHVHNTAISFQSLGINETLNHTNILILLSNIYGKYVFSSQLVQYWKLAWDMNA